ncbi:hypothetical protein ACA910_004702 [Epithemia clementina (nom. ined.)]
MVVVGPPPLEAPPELFDDKDNNKQYHQSKVLASFLANNGAVPVVIFVTIVAMYSICSEGYPHLTWLHWFMVCDFFVVALEYTLVGNAVILSNLQSLLLLASKL